MIASPAHPSRPSLVSGIPLLQLSQGVTDNLRRNFRALSDQHHRDPGDAPKSLPSRPLKFATRSKSNHSVVILGSEFCDHILA